MKRQQRTTAILLALLLVLAAAVYLLEFRPAEDDASSELQYEPLWEIAASQVHRMTLAGAGGETYQIERDEVGAWHFVAPFQGEAEQWRTENMVDSLGDLSVLREFTADEVDLIAFGLDTPTATVVLDMYSGDQYVLDVGEVSPKGDAYYVRWGETVYLCSRGSLDAILGIRQSPPLPQGVTPALPAPTP